MPPRDRRQPDEIREQRLIDLRIRVQRVAQDIRTPEDWSRCLVTAARLPAETWANILLISSGKPDATLVHGYQAWRTLGRRVIRAEKGIAIFSTAAQQRGNHRGPAEKERGRIWRDADHVTYVWDLSQTTGQALPIPVRFCSPSAEAPPGMWDALCWLARREGYAVEREHGCPDDGTTLWTARRIRVLPALTSSQAVWALAHQLGHVLLHSPITSVPRTTTTGCQGVQKAEADAVAFITCIRYGIPVEHAIASPQIWAGTDPRAQPGATILAVGQRITTAAATISRHLDHHLRTGTPDPPAPARTKMATPTAAVVTPAPSPDPNPRIEAVLLDAEQFYTSQLATSWAPAYLRKRGITTASSGEWHIGYAPGGWTALTSHLRSRGHHDDEIQAAGLARLSSRGTLIDHFRDRVMLPVHDEQGTITGFIGRARPGAAPNVPRYLNGPATTTYKKGDLLFGLHHARGHLARGAIPVIVEGPFDAIAVTLADPHHYAGLAPCGTALTSHQAAALGRATDLRRTGVLIAFDHDPAGRKAAIHAYDILRPISDRLQSVTLSGKDPAEILETEGPIALRTILQDRIRPLSGIVIDAHLEPWERRLRDPEGPLLAMRSAAALIADLLPPRAAEAIRQITRNKELGTFDERMHLIPNPELPEIARALPPDTIYQIIQTADRLGFSYYSDVLTEVVNAATRKAALPKGIPHDTTSALARKSYPHPPLTVEFGAEPTTIRLEGPGSRAKPIQIKRSASH